MSGQAHNANDIPIEVLSSHGCSKLDTLNPFCYSADHGYGITEPWWADGFAVATDGRIMAFVPHKQFDAAEPKRKRPNLRTYLQEPDGLTWQAMPQFPDCPECSNTGIVPEQDCEECCGTGEVEHGCDCEHCTIDEEDCEECGGTGTLKGYRCHDCFDPEFAVQIGDCNFARGYLRKIAALGAAEVALHDATLRFRCGEFRGLLMGFSKT